MAEELRLTMEALEGLYRTRVSQGWDLRVYDYTSNSWCSADEAFAGTGTYEIAVLTPPGGRPVRVRVLPPGGTGLAMEVASAGEMGPWRSLGLRLSGRHLELIVGLLEGRSGTVDIEELAELLRRDGSDVAREVLEGLGPILPGTPPEGEVGGDGKG